MDKKILFIAGTHGDEPVGPALLEKLSKERGLTALYESVIGNPLAQAQNKRFTEDDLNRVAPGDDNSPIYEFRRASELVALFKQFDHVIDFHETKANDRIVIIIPRLNRNSLALAISLNIDEVLIWPPASPNATAGPLVQYAPCGIEIESGTKNSFERTLNNLAEITVKFLKNGILRIKDNLTLPPSRMEQKKFYLVYGRIEPSEVREIEVQDFRQIDTGREKFIALAFGKHQGLKGYKMRVLDTQKVFDMIASGEKLL